MTIAAPPASALPARDAPSRIVAAGLAGGAVDLAYASAMGLLNGGSAARPWQVVASGWIGPSARDSGAWAVVLGVVTHFGIATCMAAAYALAARRWPDLYRRWPLYAVAYGIVLYGVMYRVVLPLRWPGAGAWAGVQSLFDIAAHVGLALATAYVLSRPARGR
ncbi:MAG: hypothetical protein ACOY5Y_07325 [Pseudomonadota bacterium]